MANQRICSVEGCGKPSCARGWCNMHYLRWFRGVSLTIKGYAERGAPMEFIREVALPYIGDDCLIWPFHRSTSGYAYMNKRQWGTGVVPRIICIESYGPPPTQKHEAAHSCGNGSGGCVNPRHLRWSTPCENQADKIKHGTTNRGSRQGRSKLTEDDVKIIRSLKNKLPNRGIARRFNVSESNIRLILKRKNWAWLD